ncbi:MAG: DUF5688 family protein [Anaerocolumna aminovalerica]|uniref:DUF5688 family protein n=1 Tax=Anaerocolumna aminovalerica TaxID=1527 RepID=UPI001C0E937F|nr:DUF5688 family protein [Anaerocolumna aminovalerica]MBU5331767.1 hypothetical protein [Anaerocolumna aminovalerica]MDU6264001.1 DUF5688 family protein [Anaerocolumna aminovalerica]
METKNTKEIMTYEQFLARIKAIVKKRMGGGYLVDINHVIKNNSIQLDGLIILKNGERITPNIYLNSYFESYQEGESIEDIAAKIINIYEDTMEEGEREALCIQFELNEMKSSIIFRLVNYDKNIKLLNEIPHIRFLDLAITFHCLVKDNENGIGTIRITNEHIKNWNTTLENITELATINTPVLLPASVRSMNEVIIDILNKEMEHNSENIDVENEIKEVFDQMKQDTMTDMYVLSNAKGINGASCLLYPDVVKELSDQLNTDFYILPSSIHEIILVKNKDKIDKNVLREMVIDVNYTQVAEDEILSNNIYFYSRKRDALTLL